MNKLLILLFLLSFNSIANWQFQPDRSSVSFVSTKLEHILEIHEIQGLEVEVKDDKQVIVRMDLSSVESGIPIRNERMRNMLFNLVNFPYATLSLTLPQALSSYSSTSTISLDATLSLNGAGATIPLELLLVPGKQGVTATLLKPVIVPAGQFDLMGGVEKLREIAGLNSIGYSVPVFATISLVKN